MAFFTGNTTLHDLYFYYYYHLGNSISPQLANRSPTYDYPAANRKRWLSTGTESTPDEFQELNAYELLGVSESSSFAEIKASFYKLAKETHPDLAAESRTDSSASKRFIQILAAYEILSDSEKRAHYDQYLLSQRTPVQRHSKQGPVRYEYELHESPVQMEVVEWLRWYRSAINDILSEKRVVVGSGYFDVLERDFYSAMHAAYYGPEIESLDLLPDCFEAEERSDGGTPEVLHLVSGRDLFGMVRLADKIPELSDAYIEKLPFFASDLCQSVENADDQKNSYAASGATWQKQVTQSDGSNSDAYKDLELHVAGRLVAVATRVTPKRDLNRIQNEDFQDRIHVYLTPHEDLMGVRQGSQKDFHLKFSVGCHTPLGTITGLGTGAEEGSCYVYDSSGVNTHIIVKHRTFLVKHMHWYQVGDEVSVCECRSTRAQLPPSKFWLFEPRCGMHDIGGWYVETFGRDKKGRTIPSQRHWDGLESFEKRLHPAMYLLALAYKTLDIEDARRRKKTVKDVVEAKMFRILNWCKKLV